MAALAETQEALHEQLKEVAPTPPPELLAAWQVGTRDSLRRAEAEAAMGEIRSAEGEVRARWRETA